MASEKLKKYLRNLAQDASLRQKHLSDPIGTMTSEGLDQSHQDMIMNGDLDGLKKTLGPAESCLVLSIGSYKK